KQMRQYGWDENRVATVKGALSRLDALHAAVLSVKLPTLESDNGKRRAIAEIYDKTLNWEKFRRHETLHGTTPAYHLYAIIADNRDDFRKQLQAENVECGLYYAVPAHKNPAYAPLCRMPASGLTVTENLSKTVLSLPIYPELSLITAQKIAEFINDL